METNNEDLCVLRNAGYGKLENESIFWEQLRKTSKWKTKECQITDENTSEY
jgi:hypothetical protein